MFSATPSSGTLTFWNIKPPLRAMLVAAAWGVVTKTAPSSAKVPTKPPLKPAAKPVAKAAKPSAKPKKPARPAKKAPRKGSR